MKTNFSALDSMNQLGILACYTTFILAITLIDSLSFFTVSLAPLLLLPVVLSSWYGGVRVGLLIACISAIAVLFSHSVELSSGLTRVAVYSSLVYLTAFCILTLLVSNFNVAFKMQAAAAEHDPLTGLLNLRGLTTLINEEIARSKRYHHPFTVAYIDIDDFKSVNDSDGHANGDRLLCNVGKLILSSIRESDYTARIGGDEFVCLLPETAQQDARHAFNNLRTRLANTFVTERVPVTFSVGVVTFESPPDSVQEALSLVDTLMYKVKKVGKNDAAYEIYNRPTLR
ncbi:GGDEF domain-containing protein [Alteromonas antoniana]|uniref:GGDEF domain-containing protein n=1 Tax=Alteromonas antoniana TaxID=2803813 RepID=UPI00308468D6